MTSHSRYDIIIRSAAEGPLLALHLQRLLFEAGRSWPLVDPIVTPLYDLLMARPLLMSRGSLRTGQGGGGGGGGRRGQEETRGVGVGLGRPWWTLLAVRWWWAGYLAAVTCETRGTADIRAVSAAGHGMSGCHVRGLTRTASHRAAHGSSVTARQDFVTILTRGKVKIHTLRSCL